MLRRGAASSPCAHRRRPRRLLPTCCDGSWGRGRCLVSCFAVYAHGSVLPVLLMDIIEEHFSRNSLSWSVLADEGKVVRTTLHLGMHPGRIPGNTVNEDWRGVTEPSNVEFRQYRVFTVEYG